MQASFDAYDLYKAAILGITMPYYDTPGLVRDPCAAWPLDVVIERRHRSRTTFGHRLP